MTVQDWIILAMFVIPILGGMLTAAFRALGWGRAAAVVEALQPLALRAAHEAATKPKADDDEPKDPPEDPPSGSAAPPSTVVMPPSDNASSGLLRVAFAMFAALALAGCGAMQKVEHVVQLSSEVIARAEPCLMLQYEQAQVACLDLPSTDAARACVDSVKVTWKPIIDALGELRDVRCGLEPAKCEAQR